MTWLVDNVPQFPSTWDGGEVAGLGVKGIDIPSLGESGPSIFYEFYTPGVDDAVEFRAVFQTVPSGPDIEFDCDELGVFVFTAPDGTYQATFNLYRDGVLDPGGPHALDLIIGAGTGAGGIGGVGNLVLKGGAASAQIGVVMDGGASKLALKGGAGALSLGGSFVAQPGPGFLPLKGAQAALVQGRVFGPGAGKISLKGDGASVQIGVIFAPGAGILPLKGAAAVLAFETLAVYAYGEEILLVDGSFDSRIITLTGHEDIMKVFGDADIVIVYPPIEVPGDT